MLHLGRDNTHRLQFLDCQLVSVCIKISKVQTISLPLKIYPVHRRDKQQISFVVLRQICHPAYYRKDSFICKTTCAGGTTRRAEPSRLQDSAVLEIEGIAPLFQPVDRHILVHEFFDRNILLRCNLAFGLPHRRLKGAVFLCKPDLRTPN